MKAGIVRIKPEAALLRERKIQLICSAAGLDVKRKLIVLFFYAFVYEVVIKFIFFLLIVKK